MSELERIRRDLREHAADDLVEPVNDPAFDAALAEVLDDHEWSDATIDALSEIVDAVPQSDTARRAALSRVAFELRSETEDLDLGTERRRAGISEDAAAAMLGTDAARLLRMEGQAVGRWLELQPAAVAQYLERIGLSAVRFARWLSRRLGGPEQAFGYRPGFLAEHPVEVDAEAPEHLQWLESLLAAPDVDRYLDAPSASVFGVQWDPSSVELHRAQVVRRVRAALLRRLMTLDLGEAADALGVRPRELGGIPHVIGLPTEDGFRYPSFQFDAPRRRIRPIVAYCNQLLRPERDPWGAASWWVSDHDWLGQPPLTLLDAPGNEERLRQAADMIGQYDG